MQNDGTLGDSCWTIDVESDGHTTIQVQRNYDGGTLPNTAQRVWEMVSDFGGVKTMFPNLVRMYLTYPDDSGSALHTVRSLTFATPNNPENPLAFVVEELVELDDQARRLAYTMALGLPVKEYRAVMEVTGLDACRLTWTSTYIAGPEQEWVAKMMAEILSGGANQIATALGRYAP